MKYSKYGAFHPDYEGTRTCKVCKKDWDDVPDNFDSKGFCTDCLFAFFTLKEVWSWPKKRLRWALQVSKFESKLSKFLKK